jgi:hypothetical protein
VSIGELEKSDWQVNSDPLVYSVELREMIWADLMDRVAQNCDVALRLVTLFIEKSGEDMALIALGIECQDPDLLRLSSHGLMGATSYFSKDLAYPTLAKLEALARSGSFETAEDLLMQLKQEMTLLLTLLKSFVSS